MAKRRRLKTETQLITRKNNERAYAQTLHSILFLSGNIVSGDKSANMMRSWQESVYQYEDTFMQEDGTIRREYYNALVMDDCIHIKVSFIQEWDEKTSKDKGQGIGTVQVNMPNYSVKGEIKLDSSSYPEVPMDERYDWGMDEDEVEFEESKGPKVLGKIDLCTPNGNHK